MRNSSHSSVSMTLEDTDPRDPKAKCDRCSRQGTIARAMRHTDPPLVLRYCGPCWPAAQDELLARQREEGERWQRAHSEWFDLWRRGAQGTAESPPRPAPWSISSRSWHDTRRFLAAIAKPFEGGDCCNIRAARLDCRRHSQQGSRDGWTCSARRRDFSCCPPSAVCVASRLVSRSQANSASTFALNN
jgi:hypothetical protein